MSLFAFEQDFASNLRCIPMIVRFKLDRCGVKLKLHQWNKLTTEQKQLLIDRPCEQPQEVNNYQQELCQLVLEVCEEEAKLFTPDREPLWQNQAEIPDRLLEKLSQLNIKMPLDFWQNLEVLERFTLIKLSQAGHENHNFIPALQEFGFQQN